MALALTDSDGMLCVHRLEAEPGKITIPTATASQIIDFRRSPANRSHLPVQDLSIELGFLHQINAQALRQLYFERNFQP